MVFQDIKQAYYKLEQILFFNEHHPAQRNAHIRQTQLHNGSALLTYQNLSSFGVLNVFRIYKLSPNWMTPSPGNTTILGVKLGEGAHICVDIGITHYY